MKQFNRKLAKMDNQVNNAMGDMAATFFLNAKLAKNS